MKNKGYSKRILAVLCALAMVVSMFPGGLMSGGITFAAEEEAAEAPAPEQSQEIAEETQAKPENNVQENSVQPEEGVKTQEESTAQNKEPESKPEAQNETGQTVNNSVNAENKKDGESVQETEEIKDKDKETKKEEKTEKEKSFKVEFDFGDNYARFNSINPKKTDENGKFTIPEKPEARERTYKAEDGREYYFTGWRYKDKEYDPGDEIRLDEDAKLKAIWKQTYTIKFSARGVKADSIESQTEVYDEPVVLPEEIADKEGMDFAGWTPDDGETVFEAGKTIYANRIQPKSRAASKAVLRLAAELEPSKPSIHFVYKGQDGAEEDSPVKYQIFVSEDGSSITKREYAISETESAEESALSFTEFSDGEEVSVEQGKYLYVRASYAEDEQYIEYKKAEIINSEDNEDPSVTIDKIDDSSEISAAAAVAKKTHVVEFSASDNSASFNTEDNVIVKLDGSVISDVTYGADGKGTITLTEYDGTKTLYITATDASGNYKSVSQTLVFDGVDPEVSITMTENVSADEDGKYYYNAENAKATIEVKDEGSELSSVTVVAKAGDTEIYTKSKDEINNKSYSISEENLAAGNLVEGELTVKVTAEDEAGNKIENYSTITNSGGTEINCIVDTIAPVLLQASTSPTGKSPEGFDSYYYNSDPTTLYEVKETYIKELNVTYTSNHEAEISSNNNKVSVTWKGENKNTAEYTNIVLTGIDKAGNKLKQVDDNYSVNSSEDDISITSLEDGVSFGKSKIIDRKAPTARIEYSAIYAAGDDAADANVYVYDENGTRKAYLNGDVWAKVTIEDDNELVPSYILSYKNDNQHPQPLEISSDGKVLSKNEIYITWEGGTSQSEEGENRYILYGTDVAGNPIDVTQDFIKGNVNIDMPDSCGEIKDEDAAKSKLLSFVRDTVNPKYTSSIEAVDASNEITPENKDERVDVNNIAYYKSGLKVTFDISEVNVDPNRMKAGIIYGQQGTPDYYSNAAFTWTDPTEEVELKNTETGATKEFNVSDQGAYRFNIIGWDKAGNPLMKSEAEIGKTDYTQSKCKDEYKDEVSFWTETKVIDNVAPDVIVSADDFFRLKFQGEDTVEPEVYDPFQRNKTSATVSVKQKDKSPVRITYSVPWKSPDKLDREDRSKGFLNGTHDEYVVTAESKKGTQFSVDNIIVKDMAGNISSYDKSGYIIYLDNAAPEPSEGIDAVKPFVRITADKDITKSSPDGQNLYSNSVGLNLTVVDPNKNKSSSGLKQVKYWILVDGKQIDSGSLKNLVGENEILWDTKAEEQKEYAKTNTGLKYEIDKAIKLKSYKESKDSTFESNDIVIKLYAVDNAGNNETASVKLGIDTVGPEVLVRYNNNSAQNGKYFKANRTATVTVKERNLGNNSDKIRINTQVGVPSSWSWKAGGAASGNDDTWTKLLHYSKDGDYTLGIAGTDALGNAAHVKYEGTAPKKFVIDKTAPVLKVTFDNNSVRNKKYYNANRNARVNIVEHNFRASDVKVAGKASGPRRTGLGFPSIGGFSSSGDSRNATIPFTKEGNFSFKVDYTDLAGNPAKQVVIDEFVIDKTKPVVKIENVINGGIYGGTVAPRAIFDDDNFSRNDSQFRFTGVRLTDRSALVPAFRANGEYGGSYVMSDFPKIRANDDIYTAYATSTDMAGNTTTVQVVFSVNRFGSSYDYNGDETTIQLVSKQSGRFYTNTPENLQIREININPIKKYSLTLDRGDNTIKLKEGTDYSVVKSDSEQGTVYIYKISKDIVEDEGSYNIVVKSEDAAGNINTNAAIRSEEESEEVPVRFIYDVTKPTLSFLHSKNETEIIELEANKTKRFSGIDFLDLGMVPDDDWALGSIQYILEGRDGVIYDSQLIKGDKFWDVMGEDGVKHFDQDVLHGTDTKKLTVKVYDAAGNEESFEYGLLVTSNVFEVALHYWYWILLALAAATGGYAYYRKRRNKKEAEEA